MTSLPLRPGDPDRLGGYELLGRLGEGGMGVVYLGRGQDERPVAIKVVRSEYAAEPEFRGRFRSEVRRAQQVPPFSTAEVLGADPDHDPPYLVVEYVEGPSLAAVIRERGPLRGAALHGVAVGIATALTAIHGAGVIHRDLKPSNVLVAPGGVKVIDFGIARPLEATSAHTRTDQMVGTVAYMAPERFDPAHVATVSFPADIFAWGAVVAYAATGRTPFAAESPPATAMRIMTQPPDLTGLDGPLRAVVERALAKDPAARPTARQLLDTLLAAERVDPVPVPVPVARPRRGRRWAIAAAVLLLGLAAGGGIIALSYASSSAPDRKTPPVAATRATTQEDMLNGDRKILLHLADIDRDLELPVAERAKPGGGTTPESVFTLVPSGVDHLIRSAVPDYQGAPRCLGVKLDPQGSASLVETGCGVTKATLFHLSRNEHLDEQGRPTYAIVNDAYGIVQWNERDREIYVEEAGDGPNDIAFSLVDRGAA
ncbi:serine/threonine-protein kinase [Actinoplanes sp. RD1]|uniref:serine/threonine-protein kinase n=1 Tax=Actinoplanes sp. RD1 TaxID=3064538 RepID=UPI00274183B4|nr:serine/threonine-protein kinase [Actinoplanes sp. RD1]